MNFLEEVEPYRVYIDMYLDKGAMPNLKIREELSDLDYRLRMHERVAMYGKANIELYPTDMACASCVKSMVNNLRRWINIKEAEEKEMIKKTALDMVGWTDKFPEEETVEFKGVPDKEIAGYKVIDLTKMKWGAFKSYCKGKGLNVKGKTRAQLNEELTSL